MIWSQSKDHTVTSGMQICLVAVQNHLYYTTTNTNMCIWGEAIQRTLIVRKGAKEGVTTVMQWVVYHLFSR
ncbi:hypothetical protein E2562_022519 [Oryza meyeriana var. granulata]|uniref:Uncharacterized protein n=1 Tax=Oryza meyeriana var. granulata TaxID=110450 RepID=A0A6G1BPH1_9ORYZ|nr:hypothetical protein E2562_022519 [Oryza meyeriana var. granulata]